MQWIAITGNPKDGFSHIGPFDHFEDAMLHGDKLEADWWIVQLQEPARDMSQSNLHSVRADLH